MANKNVSEPQHACVPTGYTIVTLLLAAAVVITGLSINHVNDKVLLAKEAAYASQAQIGDLLADNAALHAEVASLQEFRNKFKTQIRKTYHVKTKVETQIESRPVSLWTTQE